LIDQRGTKPNIDAWPILDRATLKDWYWTWTFCALAAQGRVENQAAVREAEAARATLVTDLASRRPDLERIGPNVLWLQGTDYDLEFAPSPESPTVVGIFARPHGEDARVTAPITRGLLNPGLPEYLDQLLFGTSTHVPRADRAHHRGASEVKSTDQENRTMEFDRTENHARVASHVAGLLARHPDFAPQDEETIRLPGASRCAVIRLDAETEPDVPKLEFTCRRWPLQDRECWIASAIPLYVGDTAIEQWLDHQVNQLRLTCQQIREDAHQTAEAATNRLVARHPGLIKLGPRHLGIAGTVVEFILFVEEHQGQPHLLVGWLPDSRDPDGTPFQRAEALRLEADETATDALLDRIINVERHQDQAGDRTGDHMVKIHRPEDLVKPHRPEEESHA
jgi:hypothetical protein